MGENSSQQSQTMTHSKSREEKKKARKKKQIMNERAHIALHFVTEKIA